MSTPTKIGLQAPESWDGEWGKWFARYSQGSPRLGTWIASRYPLKGRSTLEIGAGSGRESRFLARTAESVTCADFAPEAVRLLTASMLPPNMKSVHADAFHLPFPDNSFDLTFHKGVWILFLKNKDLELLLQEQLRVTRWCALAATQNAMNAPQVSYARKQAELDPLFQIRFFYPRELHNLAQAVLGSIPRKATYQVLKYGAPTLSKRLGGGRIASFLVNASYPLLPWSWVECAVLEIKFQ